MGKKNLNEVKAIKVINKVINEVLPGVAVFVFMKFKRDLSTFISSGLTV